MSRAEVLNDPQTCLSYGTHSVYKNEYICQHFNIRKFHTKNPDVQYLMEKTPPTTTI